MVFTSNHQMPEKKMAQAMLPNPPPDSARYPLWFGGSASCCAVCLTHPLDLTKVRMQTSQLRIGMFRSFSNIIKSEGVLGFYNGLSAGVARQCDIYLLQGVSSGLANACIVLYGSTRFAIYETIKSKYTKQTQKQPPLAVTVAAASLAGFVGGIVGNPADIAIVRMQSDGALPPHARRNYRSLIDAFVRFKQEEGWRGYTRGVWANASRASLMTSCQLASYDAFKDLLIEKASFKNNLGSHFASSLLAGLVATTICSPLDVIKSRIMSFPERKSILFVARDLWRKEGFFWLFRGWVPSFIRTGPHTVATFMFLEQHKKIYRKLKGRKSELAMI